MFKANHEEWCDNKVQYEVGVERLYMCICDDKGVVIHDDQVILSEQIRWARCVNCGAIAEIKSTNLKRE